MYTHSANQSLPPTPNTYTLVCTHISYSGYIIMLESYITQESDFFLFITKMQEEYTLWLKEAGEGKFKTVSMQETLAGTLEEVCMFGLESTEMMHGN